MRRVILATVLTVLSGSGAMAQSVDCAATPDVLPPSLAHWPDARPIAAAADPASAGKVRLEDGSTVDARLTTTSHIRYAVTPEKQGISASYGGLLTLTVKAPGLYRVALGSAAWVDMIADGRAVMSTAHGHGPTCSGIRKMVDFPLKTGEHLIQIAGSAAPSIRILAVRLP